MEDRFEVLERLAEYDRGHSVEFFSDGQIIVKMTVGEELREIHLIGDAEPWKPGLYFCEGDMEQFLYELDGCMVDQKIYARRKAQTT